MRMEIVKSFCPSHSNARSRHTCPQFFQTLPEAGPLLCRGHPEKGEYKQQRLLSTCTLSYAHSTDGGLGRSSCNMPCDGHNGSAMRSSVTSTNRGTRGTKRIPRKARPGPTKYRQPPCDYRARTARCPTLAKSEASGRGPSDHQQWRRYTLSAPPRRTRRRPRGRREEHAGTRDRRAQRQKNKTRGGKNNGFARTLYFPPFPVHMWMGDPLRIKRVKSPQRLPCRGQFPLSHTQNSSAALTDGEDQARAVADAPARCI